MSNPSMPLKAAVTPTPAVGVVNLANAVTVFRLALVPVFGVFLLLDGGDAAGWRYAATAVFAVAAISDRLDGEIARRRGLVTDFGTIADPIADKALIGMALIGLSALGELPWWVTIVILVREVGVTLLRFWVIHHGIMAASLGGKLKTLLQGIAIGLYVLPLSGWPASARVWFMGAAVVVTLATGVHYVGRALALRRVAIHPERS